MYKYFSYIYYYPSICFGSDFMWLVLFARLLLAFVLGSVIGYEREHIGRPAGLRTHVLVCVGAALVQITALDFYALNPGYSSDPFRMGAQVISGIGFLGAGTIIKEGASVKGLTTAATLWVVACVGLAAGTGMYIEAIVATLLLYIGLKGLKKVEQKMTKVADAITIQMIMPDAPGKIGEIGSTLGALEINILGMDVQQLDDDILIELSLKPTKAVSQAVITEALYKIPHIKSIKVI
jgi:putative Mg2+ transporter-C (MgtC) family protein